MKHHSSDKIRPAGSLVHGDDAVVVGDFRPVETLVTPASAPRVLNFPVATRLLGNSRFGGSCSTRVGNFYGNPLACSRGHRPATLIILEGRVIGALAIVSSSLLFSGIPALF